MNEKKFKIRAYLLWSPSIYSPQAKEAELGSGIQFLITLANKDRIINATMIREDSGREVTLPEIDFGHAYGAIAKSHSLGEIIGTARMVSKKLYSLRFYEVLGEHPDKLAFEVAYLKSGIEDTRSLCKVLFSDKDYVFGGQIRLKNDLSDIARVEIEEGRPAKIYGMVFGNQDSGIPYSLDSYPR